MIEWTVPSASVTCTSTMPPGLKVAETSSPCSPSKLRVAFAMTGFFPVQNSTEFANTASMT